MPLRLLLLLSMLLASLPMRGATPPSWLTPYLTPEARAWEKATPAIVLIDSTDCRMTSANHAQYTKIGAILVHKAEPGAGKAVARLPFIARLTKINGARAWIIRPNGDVTTIKRDKFVNVSEADPRSWHDEHVLMFSPDPQLKDDYVLAWEFEYETETGPLATLGIELPNLPVRRADFRITPFPGSVVTWHNYDPALPNPSVDKSTGAYSWIVENIGKRPHPKLAGFLKTQNRIGLRVATGPDAAKQLDSWQSLGAALYPIVSVGIVSSPTIKQKSEALIAGQSDRWGRIRSLSDFVQRGVGYLTFARETDYMAGFRPQTAAETLSNRYGDCKDKATLLISMLQAIGEEGYVMLLYANDPLRVQSDWPANVFNHAIVAIPAGADAPANWSVIQHPTLGKFIAVDATTTRGPLGILPLFDQGGHALFLHPEQPAILALPFDNPSFSTIKTNAHLSLEPGGDATVVIDETYRGQPGLSEHLVREGKTSTEVQTRVERRLHGSFAIIKDLQASDSWEQTSLSLAQKYQLKAPRYARRTGADLLLVSMGLSPALDALEAWKTDLPGMILLHQGQFEAEITLALPEGLSVSRLPPALHAVNGGASLDIECIQKDNTIVYRSRFFQPGGIYAKPDYEGLRSLRQKYLQAQKIPLILKVAGGAGN